MTGRSRSSAPPPTSKIRPYDLHDREPWPLRAAVILAGGVAMALAGPIEDSIIRRAGACSPSVAPIAARMRCTVFQVRELISGPIVRSSQLTTSGVWPVVVSTTLKMARSAAATTRHGRPSG
jgi:hypothetical protein